jgi:hypothetical protein
MSKITTERYDPVRIERIRHFLESNAEKGKSKFYEIFVDNLKAVDKTDDIGCFDEYKMYMDENTQMIKILIYTSTENCPRNDKFIFSVRNPQEEKRQEQLNGIDFQNKIDTAIQQERERTQLLQLQKELTATKAELKEAEEYADSLQDKLEQTQSEFKQFKEKRISLSEMNTGRLVGFMTNYFVKTYPSLAQKVPLLSTLSGYLTDDEESPNHLGDILNTGPENSVSFSKKNEDSENVTEDDSEEKYKLAFFKEMEDNFSIDQLKQVCEIIKGMQAQPDQIGIVHSLFYPPKSK